MSYIFDIITLFPEVIEAYVDVSIIGRARKRGLLKARCHNPRDHATDKHGSVDDTPYGGGAGMLMMAEPLAQAIEGAKAKAAEAKVILLSPAGRRFNQAVAEEFAQSDGLILVCGRYEGVDERVIETLVDDELSVGDFVLTGGELGALTVIDAVARQLPGVLGNDAGPKEESFAGTPLLEFPQYTRPRSWRGRDVPGVLLSGDHGAIARWRQDQREARTRMRRPDLWEAHQASSPNKDNQ